jgi:hypothetical protein
LAERLLCEGAKTNTIAGRIYPGASGIHLKEERVPFSTFRVKYSTLHARAVFCHLQQAPFHPSQSAQKPQVQQTHTPAIPTKQMKQY